MLVTLFAPEASWAGIFAGFVISTRVLRKGRLVFDLVIVFEDPQFHLLWLVCPVRLDQASNFATMDMVSIQSETVLVLQVTGYRPEVIFDCEGAFAESQLAENVILSLRL